MFKQFIIAWQFLTIILIDKRMEVTAESLGKSMAVFPLVGILLGCMVAILDMGFTLVFPIPVASALSLACYIAMYGGFHLDGLADTVDGLAGGNDREQILKIMKDSSIGAIGVVALVLLLLLKYMAITSLPIGFRQGGLIFMPVVGRWVEVFLVYGSKYAREGSGLGKPFVEYVGKKEIAIATILTVVISLFLLDWRGIIVVAAVALLGLTTKSFFNKKIGGITGDVLGAGGEVSEVLALLFIIAIYQ